MRIHRTRGAWCLFIGRLRLRRVDHGSFRPLFSERYGYVRWHWITNRLAWRRI